MPNKKRFQERPEWSILIAALRESLQLTQSEFGAKFGVHMMTVSRWERGTIEPQPQHYIALGNLVGNPQCWYFWTQAGLKRSVVVEAVRAAGL